MEWRTSLEKAMSVQITPKSTQHTGMAISTEGSVAAWQVTFQLDGDESLHAAILTANRRPSRKGLCHQFRRCRVEHLEPAGAGHAPAVEQHHRGRDAFELRRVVTDIDHGHVGLVAEPLQIRQNLALPGGVERGERLVEEEEPRAHQERAAEG